MDVLAWFLLIVLLVLCTRLRTRVARLESRLTEIETGRRSDAITAALLREARGADPAPVPEPMPEPAWTPEPATAEPMSVEPPVPGIVEREAVQPAAMPEPAPEPTPKPPHAPAHAARSIGFEDIFGRYLPIWAGGITLVVAGVLIVRYSIEAGLLTPVVRVIAGLLFGAGLIAGAEIALRSDRWVRDRRVGQALAGAGLATLYASILVAANLYGLIAPLPAFVGLALVTLAGAGLSLRFGSPSAVLGLVGGLAAPALVGAETPNVPLLATYLAFVVGGLSALGRTQRWWWLGALAIAGGFGWGAALILAGLGGTSTALSVGLFTLLLAIAFPLLLGGEASGALRLGAALAGCAQMAALVATGGFGGLEWGLYGLIAAALVWLSRREPMLTSAPLASVAVGLLLTFAWPDPDARMLAAVLAGGALIHGVPAMLRLWRSGGRQGDAVQIAAASFGIAVVPLFHFDGLVPAATLAPLAGLGALIAGGAAALGWRSESRTGDARFATLALTGLALALLGVGLVIEPSWLPVAAAVAASVALSLALRAGDRRVELGGQGFALFAVLTLLPAPGDAELAHAAGLATRIDATGAVRWIVPALAALGFARWSVFATMRALASGAGVALAYVGLAQLLPVAALALIPAAMLAALAFAPLPRASSAPPLGVAAAIALCWAAQPLLLWLDAGAWALLGTPFHATALPVPGDALLRIGAPVIALLALRLRRALPGPALLPMTIALAMLLVVTAHIGWKQLFAIGTVEAFVAHGVAERTLWELLLLGAAFAAARLHWRWTALGLALAGLLHFVWFSALLHDPLWSPQAVGPWLLPAAAAAWAAAWLAAKQAGHSLADRVRQWVQMALILLLAAWGLRQLFHGSLFWNEPVTELEDICRSLVAILLAIGFLYHGIAGSARDWRLVSLVLMLGAVGKVFLLDAAGLGGLLRIGSFVALGFSLILVGWLYSRFLPDARLTDAQGGTSTPDIEPRG